MSPATSFDSNNVVDFVVKQGNGVKGLVDMGLETLPEQYIQPLEKRFDASRVAAAAAAGESIPIIDVSNWEDPKVAESICEAAKLGFFQIINHGVPLEVLENAKAAAHRFFALPVEEKKVYFNATSLNHVHDVRLGTSFNPGTEKVLEWKDDLTMRYGSEEEAAQFWPSVCKDELLDYIKQSELVIKKLLEVLLKGLGVNEIDKAMESVLMGTVTIRANYYPICPNPDLAVGVGGHSDTSTITILLQDDIGGLYIRGTDGVSWILVPPTKGAFVINIGDMLQIMSNDRYQSIEHQVIANKSNARVSVPIFLSPKLDACVGPLPQVLRNGEEPKYRHILYSDYYRHHRSKGHEGKKTIDFAKI